MVDLMNILFNLKLGKSYYIGVMNFLKVICCDLVFYFFVNIKIGSIEKNY